MITITREIKKSLKFLGSSFPLLLSYSKILSLLPVHRNSIKGRNTFSTPVVLHIVFCVYSLLNLSDGRSVEFLVEDTMKKRERKNSMAGGTP